jgi:hypothetical protein
MPSDCDWTVNFRRHPSIQEYILLGVDKKYSKYDVNRVGTPSTWIGGEGFEKIDLAPEGEIQNNYCLIDEDLDGPSEGLIKSFRRNIENR